MKLKYLGALTGAAIIYTNIASAGALFDPYIGATIGSGASTIFANNHDLTDPAQSYGAVIGMDVPFVRVELEYDYLNHDAYKLHLGMINVYAKMPTTVIQPYLGIGIGSTFDGHVIDNDSTINIDADTAYQAMLGLTFDLPVLPFKIDAEGRAIYIPNLYSVADITPDVLQYELRLKLRYIF